MNLRKQSGLGILAAVAVALLLTLPSVRAADELPTAAILKGVSFIDNTATLDKGSNSAMEKLLEELLADRAVSLEIRCHVAPSGNQQRDVKLSLDRARSVRRWLMDRGIAFYRLQIADPQTTALTAAGALPAENREAAGDRVEIVRMQESLPAADMLARSFQFEPVADGQEVLHDFVLVNRGAAPLNISKVRTG
jgi:hypothetical protein